MWFIMRYVGFTDFENRIGDYATRLIYEDGQPRP